MSKVIFYFGVDQWTKLIAYIQMITNVIFGSALIVQFLTLLYIGKTYVDEILEEHPSIQILLGHSGYSGLLIWFTLEFSFRLCGVATALLLLKGIKKRNPRYLGTWQIFAVICMAVDTPMTFLLIQIGPLIVTIFLIIISTAYAALTILIIELFKLELERRTKIHNVQPTDESSELPVDTQQR